MPDATLTGVRTCVFDAYGTLFDFTSAAAGCRDMVGDKVERLTALWRNKQLQYTWLRALQDRHADFWQVTGDALDFALETLDLKQVASGQQGMAIIRFDTPAKSAGAAGSTCMTSRPAPALTPAFF